jgi:hypothetical protein
MSTMTSITALGAILAALFAPGIASAQGSASGYAVHALRFHTETDASKFNVPFNAFGSVTRSVGIGSRPAIRSRRPFQTDPDPHVRFEMNREDPDRALRGG